LTYGDAQTPPAGQTLWGETDDERTAAVAWDWVEIGDGIVAMADPLGLISNLRFLNASGDPLPQEETAMRLHQMVHGLPWQSEVRRALNLSAS
jgi:hypothetical protein